MADDIFASVIPLHHAPLKKRARKAAARSGTKRPRKRKTKAADADGADYYTSGWVLPSESLIPPEFLPANDVDPEPPVTPPPTVRSHPTEETAAPARRHL